MCADLIPALEIAEPIAPEAPVTAAVLPAKVIQRSPFRIP
jgi:hypothetical protein